MRKVIGLLLLCCSSAWASCVGGDVEVEDEAFGIIYSANLEYQDDVAVFEDACFESSDLVWKTVYLQVIKGTFEAQTVEVSGAGVTGTMTAASGTTDDKKLENVDFNLSLPETKIINLPLSDGKYRLTAPTAQLVDRGFIFPEAELIKQNTTIPTLYRLKNAVLQDNVITAEQAFVADSKVNIDGEKLYNTQNPLSLKSQNPKISICRLPQMSEIVLTGTQLEADDEEITLHDVGVVVAGNAFGTFGTWSIPTRGGVGGSINSTATELAASPPGVLLGGEQTSIGMENIPVSGDLKSRLSVAVHRIGKQPYPEIFFSRKTANDTLEAGFPRLAVDSTASGLDPMLVTALHPEQGMLYRFALRTNISELREGLAGYAFKPAPSFGIFASAGFAQQNTLTASVLNAGIKAKVQENLGQGFALSIAGTYAYQRLNSNTILSHDGVYKLGYASGAWAASISHEEKDQSQVPEIAAYALTLTRKTTAQVGYTASTWNSSLSTTHDWRANNTIVTPAVQVQLPNWDLPMARIQGAYVGASVGYSLQNSAFTSQQIKAGAEWYGKSDAYAVSPYGSYDFVSRVLTLGSNIDLNSDCYTYSFRLSYNYDGLKQTQGFGLKLGFAIR